MFDRKNILGEREHKIVYRDHDLVIKRFDSTYKKSQIFNEALNISRVEETSLNVPSLLFVRQVEDDWEIAMSYIQGQTLESMMHKQPDQMESYLNIFVNLQIKIHETKAPVLSKMKDKWDQKIKSSSLMATTRMRLRLALDQQFVDLCLCHGDLFPSNIIISDDSQPYIIDWSHASLGSKFADVCSSYLDLWIVFSKELAEHYLDIYNQKTSSSRDDVLSWLSIVSAARLSKGTKSEKAFLLSLLEDL